MNIEPKRDAILENLDKVTIVLTGVAVLLAEVWLSLVVVDRWHTLSGLSRYNLIYLGVVFAILSFFQLRGALKRTLLLLTSAAFAGALWVIVTIGHPR